MTLKGFATPTATKAHANRYNDLDFKTAGKTDFSITSIGFGSYRIDTNSPINREALETALLAGINLIDTSSTYADGNSELLIGELLQKLTLNKSISRESIVIVTKAGYLQGKNYDLSQIRKKQKNPFPDLVEYKKGLEHCIHPEFLKDQITRSLERLQIETIDIYLLHNPEYYLMWAQKNNIDLQSARDEYYTRIKKAFIHLEKEVEAGRIKFYGISSNTFPHPPNDADFTSLDKVFQIANEINEQNHFAVIEFPMNLFETGAYNINQSENKSLIQLAIDKNLGILINRPLNAFYANQLIKLAEPNDCQPVSIEEIDNQLNILKTLESFITEKLTATGEAKLLQILQQTLFVHNELNHNWQHAKNIANWQTTLNYYFLPAYLYYKHELKYSIPDNHLIAADLKNCETEVAKLFLQITDYFNSQHCLVTETIKHNLIKIYPEIHNTKKLSNMAIHALRSTKGISSVLSGMTKPVYVTDMINELKKPINGSLDWSKLSSPETLLRD